MLVRPSLLLQRVFKPLNLAAYVTWAAVFASLIQASPRDSFAAQQEIAAAVLLGFLAAFVACDALGEGRSTARRALLAVEALLALGACVVRPDHMAAPALTVIVVAKYAMLSSGLVAIVAVAAIDVGLWLVFEAFWRTDQTWTVLFVYGGFHAFAALTGWYARSARDTAAALQRTNAHLLATRSLLEESARDRERLRLARELHDVAGHKLTALKLNLALLQRGSTDAQGAVETSARLASELLEDVRAVVAQLRQHDGMDLREALAQLVTPFPKLRVHLDIADDARMDNAAQAEALLRTVQEGLTNVARHANASNAWVTLRRDANCMRLTVHDDGECAAKIQEGHGLTGMRERLAALGGSLQLSQDAAGGVALDVRLPLR